TIYELNDVVDYQGHLYKVTNKASANTNLPTGTGWLAFNPPIENFNISTNYNTNGTLVIYQGFVYEMTDRYNHSAYPHGLIGWQPKNTYIPTWSSGTNYNAGALVIHNGLIYRSKYHNNTQPTPGAPYDAWDENIVTAY